MPKTTFISILRGINVSGQKSVKIPELKALYESLGFESVTTYIQSGNVVFKTSEDIDLELLSENIEKAIEKKFQFAVPVINFTRNEFNSIILSNPFLTRNEVDKERLYVTFLQKIPDAVLVEKLNSVNYLPDEFIISGKAIYVYCPNGYGRTKINNNFFENKLKANATTRNWKTVNVLLDLADKA